MIYSTWSNKYTLYNHNSITFYDARLPQHCSACSDIIIWIKLKCIVFYHNHKMNYIIGQFNKLEIAMFLDLFC